MSRRLDELDDDPLDDQPTSDLADELSGRIAELLSDRLCQPRTIRLLEDYDDQLRERGWLSARQREVIEEIENRRLTSRSGRF